MRGTIFLEGDDIELRTIERDDIGWMTDNINDPDIRGYLAARRPMNYEQENDFFENSVSKDNDQVHLKITEDKNRVGLISLIGVDNERGNAEIGLWITRDEQGKGHGTEASRLVTDYGFRELRLHRIYARVFDHNPRSKKIWKRLGYREEGKMREHDYIDGDYRDLYIYGILEDEW